MAYNVPFTDPTEHPELPNGIRVEDLSLNTSNTSLTFVGKNYPEFSVPIGKNFLHLLENFASANPPANPIKGQLWYDTDAESLPPRPQIKVYDGLNWIEVSGTQVSSSQPSASSSKVGDLWTDVANKQLYFFDGTTWILVGPQYNAGTDSGFVAEQIIDRATDTPRTVLVAYVNGSRVAILSRDSFFPKLTIEGFERINQGITMSTADFDGDGFMLNKFWGTSEKSDALIVGNSVVPAANFLRGDTVSTTNFVLNIRNSAGLRVGESLETTLSSTTTGQTFLSNKTADSAIYLRPSDGSSVPVNTLIATGSGQVGINKNPGLFPDAVTLANLDVNGNVLLNGILKNTNTTNSSSYITGSVQLAGGIGIEKNAFIGGDVDINGHMTVGTNAGGLVINPRTNEAHDIGADSSIVGSGNKRFRAIYSKNFKGDLFEGAKFKGPLEGNVQGSADSLSQTTVFRLSGDVSSSVIEFNGAAPRPKVDLFRAQRTGSTARVFTAGTDHQYQVNWFVNVSIPANAAFNVTNQPITAIGVDGVHGYWFEYSTPSSGTITLDPPGATKIGEANVKSGGQFITTLSDDIISSKSQVIDSLDSDFFLVYRASLTPGLRKINKQTLFSTAGLVPAGSIFPYAGLTPPPGYLLCDGSEQNQSTYPELFGVLGYTYRPANQLIGFNTFALPDLRGRFPMGREVMDNGNSVSILTTATSVTRNAITTINAITATFVVATANIANGPFQAGKVLTGQHGLDTTGGPVVITNVQPNTPSLNFTTITVSMPSQLTTYPAASGLTITSVGSTDAGGGTPSPSRTPAASALGVVGGASSRTLTVSQLPQHSHNLRGSAGNQYYAIRYASGTPTDAGAIPGQNHNAFNGIHLLPSSGNIDSGSPVGQPIDITNPYQTINYIIFTGRII